MFIPINGWWHRKDYKLEHSYSHAWTAANNFGNYWGVDYKPISHYRFSLQLKAGDIILVDSDNDGDWNHAGFVTETSNSMIKDQYGVYYQDYKVAQHSEDYHRWTSHSKNGWETGNQKKKYGIVRFSYK